MIKLTELSAVNFRGLRSLKLDSLGKINVFLGENNVGKTSILESIFLLTGMSNPLIPMRMNSFRDKRLQGISYLKYYFYNTDLSVVPTICGKFDGEEQRCVELHPNYGAVNKQESVGVSYVGTSTNVTELLGLNMHFKNGDGQYNGEIFQDGDNISVKLDGHYSEKMKTVFIPSSMKDGDAMDSYSELVKRQGKNELVNLMQIFDDKIMTMDALSDGVYLQYRGMHELYPLAMAGDGTRRFFNIMSFVADPTTNIVLIDEIETGLHYSAYLKLWNSLFLYAEKKDVQLFITTHSKETLYCLARAFQSVSNLASEDVCVFSLIANQAGSVDAYSVSAIGLQGAITNQIELR